MKVREIIFPTQQISREPLTQYFERSMFRKEMIIIRRTHSFRNENYITLSFSTFVLGHHKENTFHSDSS